jgi:hypothetical protein
MSEEKHAGGAPSKYDPKYCKMIKDFFNKKCYESQILIKAYKDGSTEEKHVEIPCDLPLFEKFAKKIKVHRETLLNWTKQYPEFFDAYKEAKDSQSEILITNGLRNNYAQPFAIFAAKNVIGWKDRQDITSDNKPLPNPVISVQIANGESKLLESEE